jgi:hypothetical protein
LPPPTQTTASSSAPEAEDRSHASRQALVWVFVATAVCFITAVWVSALVALARGLISIIA